MSEQTIKCPFCGGDDIHADFAEGRTVDGDSTIAAGCWECSATGPDTIGGSEADAIAAWNLRAEPELPAEVVRVVASLRSMLAQGKNRCNGFRGIEFGTDPDTARHARSALDAYDRWLAGRSESE